MSANTIDKLVVIASSTGGPKALRCVISKLNKNLDAPVIVVQHMPEGFTATLAQRLNETSKIMVSESVDGEVIEKGHVYLAKGGVHLKLVKDNSGRFVAQEDYSEPVIGLRPCANITFSSIAELSVDKVICVVLTGMGDDGCEGILDICNKHNSYTIAQNKETCVVYGMPKAVVEKGIADAVLPLEEIGKEINKIVGVY